MLWRQAVTMPTRARYTVSSLAIYLYIYMLTRTRYTVSDGFPVSVEGIWSTLLGAQLHITKYMAPYISNVNHDALAL